LLPDPATAALLQTLNPHAAGIDVGATELWVCVPPSAVAAPVTPSVLAVLPSYVRRFGAFTADLHAIAAWLRQCQVTTVAMESTGVYVRRITARAISLAEGTGSEGNPWVND
jgi:hypothetical protein